MAELSSYPEVTVLDGDERLPVITNPGVAGGNKWISADNLAAGFTSQFVPAFVIDAATYGTGLVDASSHIQAKLDAAAALGRGTCYGPPGDYLLSTRLNVPTGVILRGAGQLLTRLVADNANGCVQMTGDTDCWVEDLTIDNDNQATAIGIVTNPTSGTATHTGIRRCKFVNCLNNAARNTAIFVDFEFVDNLIDGPAGYSVQATSGVGLKVLHNRCINGGVTAPVIQVYGPTQRYTNVLVASNEVTSPASASNIPIEVTGCTGVIIGSNVINGVSTRGISTAHCTQLLIADNSIADQTTYAVEIGDSANVIINGNVVKNCGTFVNETSATVVDLIISANIYTGSGRTSAASTAYVVKLNSACKRVLIVGNVFTDWQYCGGCLLIGSAASPEDVIITDNRFHVIDANTSMEVVSFTTNRTVFRGNQITVHRNLAAGDDYITSIFIPLGGSATNVSIETNRITYLGTVSAATSQTAIGLRNTGPGTCPGLRIVGNQVVNGQIGIWSNATSTDIVIADNETRSCATADTIPATVAIRRDRRETEDTAAPTAGAWKVGDRCWNITVAADGVPGWVCTTAGTPGTWKPMAGLAQSTGWAVSNVTSDKVFDANATTIDELADVVGTLITFLISRGDLAA